MLKTAERSEFLDASFFEVQAIVTPQLMGQEKLYLRSVKSYHKLLDLKSLALEFTLAPVLVTQAMISKREGELGEQESFLGPEPILDRSAGGWRRSLARARVNLNEALGKNTVPWPFMWIAGGLALENHPDLSPTLKVISTLKSQLKSASNEAPKERDAVNGKYAPRIGAQRKFIDHIENELLGEYEEAAAQSEDLNTVSDYLWNLPIERREKRVYPAVQAFIKVNAPDLLQKDDELQGFEDFVQERTRDSNDSRAEKMQLRLKTFVDFVRRVAKEAKLKQKTLGFEFYHEQDGYVTRRFEAYLVYSILDVLHKRGIIESAPEIPRVFQD